MKEKVLAAVPMTLAVHYTLYMELKLHRFIAYSLKINMFSFPALLKSSQHILQY